MRKISLLMLFFLLISVPNSSTAGDRCCFQQRALQGLNYSSLLSSKEVITEFDGSTDYHDTSVKKIGPIFSVTAWIKPSTDKDRLIIGNDGDNRFQFAVNQGDEPVLRVYVKNKDEIVADVRATVGAGLYDGNWHQAVAVVNLPYKEVYVYFDGKKVKGDDLEVIALNKGYLGKLSNSLFIGANNRGDVPSQSNGETITEFFNGSISDVRIYGRMLSPRQVRAIFNQ